MISDTGKIIENKCNDCIECIKICPVQAFTGKNFNENESREERFDFMKCQKYFDKMKEDINKTIHQKVMFGQDGSGARVKEIIQNVNTNEFSKRWINKFLSYSTSLKSEYEPILKKGGDKDFIKNEILSKTKEFINSYRNEVWKEKDHAKLKLDESKRLYEARKSKDSNLLAYQRKQNSIINMTDDQLTQYSILAMTGNSRIDEDQYNLLQIEMRNRKMNSTLKTFQEKSAENKVNEFYRQEPDALEACQKEAFFKDNTGDVIKIIDANNQSQNIEVDSLLDFSFLKD